MANRRSKHRHSRASQGGKTAQQAPQAGGRHVLACYWLAITLAGAAVYANSITAPFLFDDDSAVVNSPSIRNLWDLRHVLFPAAETAVAGRPLVNLSFAVNYALGGLDVRG